VLPGQQHQADVVVDDDAGGVVVGEVLVQLPAQRLVETLGPLQVGDREIDEDHLAAHGGVLSRAYVGVSCADERPAADSSVPAADRAKTPEPPVQGARRGVSYPVSCRWTVASSLP